MIDMEIANLEDKADEAVRLLSAMANTKRLMILCSLYGQELTVGQLSAKVDLPQSPLSQHLSRLRALDLVKARREGQSVHYALASPEVEKVLATLYGIYCATE